MASDNLSTGFSQKLWKTYSPRVLLGILSMFLCLTLVSSCTFFRSTKKETKPAQESVAAGKASQPEEKTKPAPKPPEAKKRKPFADYTLIDQGENEVKQKFGEPDVVAKTPDNLIIWTYRPKWKLLPDNSDTVYVEFENGKVKKIIRATR